MVNPFKNNNKKNTANIYIVLHHFYHCLTKGEGNYPKHRKPPYQTLIRKWWNMWRVSEHQSKTIYKNSKTRWYFFFRQPLEKKKKSETNEIDSKCDGKMFCNDVIIITVYRLVECIELHMWWICVISHTCIVVYYITIHFVGDIQTTVISHWKMFHVNVLIYLIRIPQKRENLNKRKRIASDRRQYKRVPSVRFHIYCRKKCHMWN